MICNQCNVPKVTFILLTLVLFATVLLTGRETSAEHHDAPEDAIENTIDMHPIDMANDGSSHGLAFFLEDVRDETVTCRLALLNTSEVHHTRVRIELSRGGIVVANRQEVASVVRAGELVVASIKFDAPTITTSRRAAPGDEPPAPIQVTGLWSIRK